MLLSSASQLVRKIGCAVGVKTPTLQFFQKESKTTAQNCGCLARRPRDRPASLVITHGLVVQRHPQGVVPICRWPRALAIPPLQSYQGMHSSRWVGEQEVTPGLCLSLSLARSLSTWSPVVQACSRLAWGYCLAGGVPFIFLPSWLPNCISLTQPISGQASSMPQGLLCS